MPAPLVFITGTSTGVGKTLLTALLLRHQRSSGMRALALKPFCSGTRADVTLLRTLQDRELSLNEINPFYFPEPVAPRVAARKHHRHIRLSDTLRHIRSVATSSLAKGQKPAAPSQLLIEGSGGLLVPLGEDFCVLDLIAALRCQVLVVSQNRLGTINHTLLTVQALQAAGVRRLKVVLMDTRFTDASTKTNAAVLRELLAPVPLVALPFLGPNARSPKAVRTHAARLSRQLRRILPPSPSSPARPRLRHRGLRATFR